MSKSEKIVDHAIYFTEPSLTKQSDAQGCDMNWLYDRYAKSGVDLLDANSLRQATYGDDFVSPPELSFQDMQNRLVHIRGIFDSLSSQQRAFFKNDAMLFADFASNPANIDQMVDLKIFAKQESLSEAPPHTNPSPAGNEASNQKPVVA